MKEEPIKLRNLIEKYGEYTVDREIIDRFLIRPKQRSVWGLTWYSDYFAIVAGNVDPSPFFKADFENARKIGSIFLTLEDAEKELKRRECETLLKKYANGYEFNFNEDNYFIYMSPTISDDGLFNCSVGSQNFGKGAHIYFATRDEAQKAIDEIGKERLLRDYFQIKVEKNAEIY